jgi:hypothetical protein
MQEQLNKLAEAVKTERNKNNFSLYYASKLCDFASNSGLKRIESGADCRISSLLRLSKNLNIEFVIKNGQIEIK